MQSRLHSKPTPFSHTHREERGLHCDAAEGRNSRRGWRSRVRREGSEVLQGEERQQLFSTIVPIYDQINEVMSLGQHMEWKRLCVQYSGAKRGSKVLDLCCGSGDVTYLLAQKVGCDGKVIGLDFSAEMLKAAKNRFQEDINQASIAWVKGDAQALPFPDSSFESVTMSYGLRNVTDIQSSLREMHRVLKPGCKMAVLDFNNSTNAIIDTFQGLALGGVVVPVVSLFGMRDEYAYIRDSIKNFPPGAELEQLALDSGFSQARHYEIANGLMGILVGQK